MVRLGDVDGSTGPRSERLNSGDPSITLAATLLGSGYRFRGVFLATSVLFIGLTLYFLTRLAASNLHVIPSFVVDERGFVHRLMFESAATTGVDVGDRILAVNEQAGHHI